MGYLDRESYEQMIAKEETDPVTLSVDSLTDKSDRTVTFGKNASGSTLHVFVKDGVLHSHEYVEFPSEDYFTVTWLTGNIHLDSLWPSFYAIPEVTDAEFAELMLSLNRGLRFAGWGTQLVMEDISGYFGSTVRAG